MGGEKGLSRLYLRNRLDVLLQYSTSTTFHTLFLYVGLGVLYFREHHSRIENLRSFTDCPLSVKCLDTGVYLLSFGFFTERMCSYILDLNAMVFSKIQHT